VPRPAAAAAFRAGPLHPRPSRPRARGADPSPPTIRGSSIIVPSAFHRLRGAVGPLPGTLGPCRGSLPKDDRVTRRKGAVAEPGGLRGPIGPPSCPLSPCAPWNAHRKLKSEGSGWTVCAARHTGLVSSSHGMRTPSSVAIVLTRSRPFEEDHYEGHQDRRRHGP
jgi:hypothetical protein